MSVSATVLIGLPWCLIVTVIGLDVYMKRFPTQYDDLWRLPKPSSLR